MTATATQTIPEQPATDDWEAKAKAAVDKAAVRFEFDKEARGREQEESAIEAAAGRFKQAQANWTGIAETRVRKYQRWLSVDAIAPHKGRGVTRKEKIAIWEDTQRQLKGKLPIDPQTMQEVPLKTAMKLPPEPGPMSVGEALGDYSTMDWLEYLPIMGAAVTIDKFVTLRADASWLKSEQARIEAERAEQATTVNQASADAVFREEMNLLGQSSQMKRMVEYIRKTERREGRGATAWAHILEGIFELPSYYVDFSLAGGAAARTKAGVTTVLKKGAARLGRRVGKKFLKRKGTQFVGKVGLKAARWTAGGAARTSTFMATRVAAQYQKRRLGDYALDPTAGIVETRPGESASSALWRSWADVQIEAMSEVTGHKIMRQGGKIIGKLPGAKGIIAKIGNKIVKVKGGAVTVKFMQGRLGYDGVVGEITEERVGDVMRVVMQLQPKATLMPDWDRMKIEAGVLIAPSLVGAAAKAPATIKAMRGAKKEVAPPAVSEPAYPTGPEAKVTEGPPTEKLAEPPIYEETRDVSQRPDRAALPRQEGRPSDKAAQVEEGRPEAPPRDTAEEVVKPAPAAPAVEAKPAPKEAPAKQPWEMTRAENLAQAQEGPTLRELPHAEVMAFLATHKIAVKQALSEGKPVPAEVLAEYPELGKAEAPSEDYRGQHQAADRETGSPLHNLTESTYPEDIYSSDAARLYGDRTDDARDVKAVSIIQSMRGKPKAKVRVYRAIPHKATGKERIAEIEKQLAYMLKRGKLPPKAKTSLTKSEYYDEISDELERLKKQPAQEAEAIGINPGDWVTIVRAYAKEHGDASLRGEYKIISKPVRAEELFTEGNSLYEWGYNPTAKPTPKPAKVEAKAPRKPSAVESLHRYERERGYIRQGAEWRKTRQNRLRMAAQKADVEYQQLVKDARAERARETRAAKKERIPEIRKEALEAQRRGELIAELASYIPLDLMDSDIREALHDTAKWKLKQGIKAILEGREGTETVREIKERLLRIIAEGQGDYTKPGGMIHPVEGMADKLSGAPVEYPSILTDQRGELDVGKAVQAAAKVKHGFLVAVEPAKIVEQKFGRDVTAKVIRAMHTAEAGRAHLSQKMIEAADKNVQALQEYIDKFSPAEQENLKLARGEPATDAGKALKKDALFELSDEARALLPAIQELADFNFKLLQALKMDAGYMESYFYGVYKNPQAVKQYLDHWRTTDKFLKEKQWPTYADAVGGGLELRDANPITNLIREFQAIMQLAAMKQLRADLLKTGKGIFIMPKVEATPYQTLNWREIGDKAKLEPAFSDLLVEPDLARLINNLIATNKVSQSKALSSVRAVNNVLRSFKFMGSMFHHGVIAKQSVVDAGPLGFLNILRGLRQAFHKGFEKNDPVFGTPEYVRYIKMGGGHQYSIEAQARRAMDNWLTGRDMNILWRTVRAPLRYSTAIPRTYVRWLFRDYIPHVKYVAYLNEVVAKEKKLGHPLADAEAIEIIKEGQNFYGMMNERLFGRSATTTSLLRFWFMAPGFREGNYRTMAKALGQWDGRGWRSRRNIPYSLFFTGLTATVGTYILTGKPPKAPEDRDEFRDLFKVKTAWKDRRERTVYIDLLTYDKDYWQQIISPAWRAITGEPAEAGKEAVENFTKTIGGMKGPHVEVARDLAAVATGNAIVDWKGDKVFYFTDPAMTKMWKLGMKWAGAAEPISMSVARRQIRKGGNPATAIVTAGLGLRPALSEHDKQVNALARNVWELRANQEALYYHLGTARYPRKAIEDFNAKIGQIWESPYMTPELRGMLRKRPLRIDVDRLLGNKILNLTAPKATLSTEARKKEADRAVAYLKNFGVTQEKARQMLNNAMKRRDSKGKVAIRKLATRQERRARLKKRWEAE